MVGEVIDVDEGDICIAVDDSYRCKRQLQRAALESPDALKWRRTVQTTVEAMEKDSDQEGSQVGLAILQPPRLCSERYQDEG